MKGAPLSGKSTVDALADQWAKLFAIYLHREGIKEVVITPGDIELVCNDASEPTIVVQELADGLHIKMLPVVVAVQLAQQHKGGFGPS